MSPSHSDFSLERYKYILSQKVELNKKTFTITSFFQGGVVVITSAYYALQLAFAQDVISGVWTKYASYGLLCLLVMLGVFTATMLAAGVSAWLNYRKEEAEFEALFLAIPRPLPRWRDAFRWYETYLLLAVIVVIVILSIVFLSLASTGPRG